MYSVNVIALEAVQCVVYCMLRRFWSWFGLKYVIKERGIYIPKRIVRKIARLTHECFEIFYYPIFNNKNSKRKTIRFWLKGSKNLQICFSIYLLKINFFPIQMQENNAMYSNQFVSILFHNDKEFEHFH